ncbi:50S ribosomal protein L30 [Chloroflexota bacterium]
MSKSKISKDKTVRITLVKSPIGYSKRQKATVQAIGFRRMQQTIEQVDSATLRGMLAKVSHLVKIEEEE